MAVRLDPWPVRARCPRCGEVRSHDTLSKELDGTKRLRCKECGLEWTWRPKARAVELAESERRAARPEREVRTCPWCGREFVPVRDAAWCSRRCREHGMRHQRTAIVGLIARTERLERRMREVSP